MEDREVSREHCLVGLAAKVSASRAGDQGSIPACPVDPSPGRVIPGTSKLILLWLPCQVHGSIEAALGLVGQASVFCDWVREKV